MSLRTPPLIFTVPNFKAISFRDLALEPENRSENLAKKSHLKKAKSMRVSKVRPIA